MNSTHEHICAKTTFNASIEHLQLNHLLNGEIQIKYDFGAVHVSNSTATSLPASARIQSRDLVTNVNTSADCVGIAKSFK